MDYTAIASALAARYALMAAPIGYAGLKGGKATYTPAEGLPPLPYVLVFPPEQSDFDTGTGTRVSVHDFKVRLLYDQAGDLARQTAALLKWAEVFDGQLRGAVQLGGLTWTGGGVARAVLVRQQVGFFNYADRMYAGIEGTVRITASESWAATA